MQSNWLELRQALEASLAGLSVRDLSGVELTGDAGFAAWLEIGERIRCEDKTIFLIGNGASASMASHFSADLAKNGMVRTQVFTDLSQITAIGNDIAFHQIYALPLRNYARSGDLLIAISSSGASPNILEAVKAGRERGVTVITLSAFQPGNPLRQSGDYNFYVPATTYGLAETAHAAILHHWMDMMDHSAATFRR